MKEKNIVLLSYIALVLILLIHAGLYFTHQIPMTTLSDDRLLDTLFNADALYLPALYKDIVVEGGGYFGHWYLPPAPYYFPDMALYFAVNALSGNYYYAIALFFMVEWIVVAWMLYAIYRFFFDSSTSFVWISIILFALYYFPSPVSNLFYISDFHYGEFMVGMILLYLLLHILFHQKILYFKIMLFFILGLLTSASDKLILLQWIYPLLLTTILFWILYNTPTKTNNQKSSLIQNRLK